MIDRENRQHVALGIRIFFEKQISASVFVDDFLLWGIRSTDPGLNQLCKDCAVCFMELDDKIYEGNGLTAEAKQVIQFLESDLQAYDPQNLYSKVL